MLSSLGKAFGLKVPEIFRLAERLGDPANGELASPSSGVAEPASDELLELYGELFPSKQAAPLAFLKAWATER